jgi:hypothetical protein
MDTPESSAPHAHPSTDDHDDTVEAHYACLERPCACLEGRVFVGYVDEYGEEREASYACRRCADSPAPVSQGQPALTFVENGGRHPRVPHAPPGSYPSPSRLLSKHMAACTRG